MGFGLGEIIGIASNPSMALGAATSIGTDYMAMRQQQKENASQREHEAALNAQNTALQREFAQMGVRWRVEDAKAAGLHPLAALGASGASYTPATVVGEADHSSSEFLGRMGQNIDRAISRVQTAEEREVKSLQIASAQADLDGKLIDNQIRARQLGNMSGPVFPSSSPGSQWDDQGDAKSLSQAKPLQRTNTAPAGPWMEGAHIADVGWARTKTGIVPIPSSDVKERIEDQFIPETMWAVRNQMAPNWGGGTKPPREMLPADAVDWRWHYGKQEWRPIGSDKYERLMEPRRKWENIKQERRIK